MSRVAKNPVTLPKGVDYKLDGNKLSVKGPNGNLQQEIHKLVNVTHEENNLLFSAANDSLEANALAGTMRALASNMVTGVSQGFVRKLQLVGVGYRAQVQGKVLTLSLGYSHPVIFDVPEGITIEATSQTELLVKGADRQLVGQVAANIRSKRPPEPYKGKGVRYADEVIILKETKKK